MRVLVGDLAHVTADPSPVRGSWHTRGVQQQVQRYVAIVPVKPPAFGKSRLASIGDGQRRDLAAAFALDTATAALAADHVAHVLVATDDAAFATRLSGLGCATVPDGDTSGLNAALREAAAEARRRWPALVPVALCADLPALRPVDLDDALSRVPPGATAFVSDADGVGTTLYCAPYDAFEPRYGPDSTAAHRAAGALALDGELLGLRRDVDDLDDLREARGLGLGRHTASLVDDLGLDPAASFGPPSPDLLHHEQFEAVPLTTDRVEIDLEAYLASPTVISTHSDGRWPLEGFTLDDDRRLVAHHQLDHEQGRAFTYLLLDPTRSTGLGCVYVRRLDEHLAAAGAEAAELGLGPGGALVTFWLREGVDADLARQVVRAVHEWLMTGWATTGHVFRVLPAETTSVAALQPLDLAVRAMALTDDHRPYLWFTTGR